MCVDRHIVNNTGYWAIINSQPGGRGRHFTKWPPAIGQTYFSIGPTCRNVHNPDPKKPDNQINTYNYLDVLKVVGHFIIS